MPPGQLRSKPVCAQCGKQHWAYVKCEDADARNAIEEANQRRKAEFIIRRPREGYLEFGDRLDPDTVRMGRTTFATKREPGQRIGSFKT